MNRRDFITKLSGYLFGISMIPSKVLTMNQEATRDQPITLFLSGDVMTGRGIDQALPHSVNPVLYETYVKNAQRYLSLAEQHSGSIPNPISYDYLWGDALDILRDISPDVRIINLETAVTTSDEHNLSKKIHYRMHPSNAPLLTKANIDACTLANNHILDWGEKGLIETLNVLKKI